MSYRIFDVPSFDKTLHKTLDTYEMIEFEKFKVLLKEGIIIGKPLSFSFLREKRLEARESTFLCMKI